MPAPIREALEQGGNRFVRADPTERSDRERSTPCGPPRARARERIEYAGVTEHVPRLRAFLLRGRLHALDQHRRGYRTLQLVELADLRSQPTRGARTRRRIELIEDLFDAPPEPLCAARAEVLTDPASVNGRE